VQNPVPIYMYVGRPFSARVSRPDSGGIPGLGLGEYASAITGASPATATRDLVDLVAKGGLVRTGELRHARYHLGVPLRPVQRVTLNQRGEPVEG